MRNIQITSTRFHEFLNTKVITIRVTRFEVNRNIYNLWKLKYRAGMLINGENDHHKGQILNVPQ